MESGMGVEQSGAQGGERLEGANLLWPRAAHWLGPQLFEGVTFNLRQN